MSHSRFVVNAWADISDCGAYRYALGRRFEIGSGLVVFVMLNPSTADAENDDPTIRRCIGFARDFGCAELVVCNLFAFRATRPADMRKAADPIGPDNDVALAHWTQRARWVIAAWGAHGDFMGRDQAVLAALRQRGGVHALGFTSLGHPRHPLYMPTTARPIAWEGKPT